MAIVTGFESCDDRACADIFCDDRHTPVLINTGVVNLEKADVIAMTYRIGYLASSV